MIKNVIRYSILFVGVLLQHSLYAQFPYINTFKHNNAAGMVMGGTDENENPSPAYLTSGIDDPVDDGYLRLTDASNYKTGYAYVDTPFPSKSGFDVVFEYFSWGGTMADGISFFLFDASKPFIEGKYGGALGYAQYYANWVGNPRNGPGMNGGFLAVGIDEYGNFGAATEGKNGGIKKSNGADYTSQIQGNGVIAIRGAVDPANPNGDGGRTGANAYPFIAGKLTQPGGDPPAAADILPLADRFAVATGTRGVNPTDANYRRVTINIKKNDELIPNSGFTINVKIYVGILGREVEVLKDVLYNIPDSQIPEYVKAGFASSTGQNTNYHEIRNLEINSAIPLNPLVADDDAETGTYNSPVDINVLTNDDATANGGIFALGTVDLDPSAPGIQSTYEVSGGTTGTFTVTPLGVVTFTPVSGFSGTATAQYVFSDDFGATSNVATITVTIDAPLNTPPVATNDAVTAVKGTSLVNIDVTANDTDTDGTIDNTTILLLDPNDGNSKKTTVTIPGEGVYSVNVPTNTVDFVPDASFAGTSTIKYTVEDDSGAESNEATISITITDPKISLIKTAGTAPTGGYKLNDVITYTFKVKNEGDVVLNNISITDDLAGVSTPVLTTGTDIGNDNLLSVGEEWEYTATYTITQTDIDAGKVINTAKVSSKDPQDNTVEDNSGTAADNDTPTETLVPQTGTISLVKTASAAPTGGYKLNDVITYTFKVKNEGTVTLKDISVIDNLSGLSTITRTIGSGTVLAPGEGWEYTATYAITQTDVDAGKVENTAKVTSKDPQDNTVEDNSGTASDNDTPTETLVPQTGTISLVKTASAAPTGGYKLNDVITYTFSVRNTGTVTLKDIVLTDNLSGLSVITRTVGSGTTLPPGAEWEYTATYTVTQSDVTAGKVINTANVSSKSPQDIVIADDSGTSENNDTPTEITINPNSPVANDDSAETEFNKEVKINLAGNDQPDGIPFDLSGIEIVTDALNGTVVKNNDGTVTYIPNSGFTGTDVFTYRIKDQNGNYTNVATVTISVTGFRISNVFTPNGDGKNDTFVIVGLDDYNNAELIVFNRWGSEVFKDVNYRNTWDGGGLNEGTYYYILKLRKAGGEEVKKGWVLIKR